MSTADQLLYNVVEVLRTVKGSSTATKGKCGVFDTDDTLVLDATAGQNPDLVFLETKAAGEQVRCALLTGGSVIPVLVGTGGATAGEYALVANDGLTNQTLGGGTTVKYIAGKFLRTGVVGDVVGLIAGNFAGVA
jgi:hypothetical protein